MMRAFSTWLVAIVIVVGAGCGGGNRSKKNESPPPKAPSRVEESYQYMESDWRGLPAPVGPEGSGAYTRVLQDGRVIRVLRRDPEGAPVVTWDYTYDGTTLKEVAITRLGQGGAEHIFFERRMGRTCALYTGRLGARHAYKCWQRRGDGTIEERSLDPYGKLTGRRILTVDRAGIVTRAEIYDEYGDLSAVEEVTLTVDGSGVHRTYRELNPAGLVIDWVETTYHPKWVVPTLIVGRYADGTVRYRTALEYDSPFSAHGTALTEEGVEYSLDLRLDFFGHRTLEVRRLGGVVVERTESEYDDAGRLVARRRYGADGLLEYSEEITYDDSGLPKERRLFSGRSWLLVCEGDHGERVTTRLPALEKAVYGFDPLGRPVSLERYVFKEFRDRRTRSYDSRGAVEEEREAVKGRADTTVTYTRDESGRVIRETRSVGGKVVEVTQLEYKGNRLVRERHLAPDGRPFTPQEAPTGSVIEYSYDSRGRLLSKRFLHADGRPALALYLPKCPSCPARPVASRISWKYDSKGRVVAVEYHDEVGPPDPKTGTLVYRKEASYDRYGRVAREVSTWVRQGRMEELATEYAKGGWVRRRVRRISERGRLLSAEVRTFDRALLVEVVRTWVDARGRTHNRITRNKYMHGQLVQRTETEDSRTVTVLIQRDQAGRRVREVAMDAHGRPAVARDIFGNEYEELQSSYDSKGRIARVVRKVRGHVYRTEFMYDSKGRPTGRRVYEDGKLALEVRELFTDGYLGEYGTSTAQFRTQIRGGRKEISSYTIKFDPADPDGSYAILKVNGKQKRLTRCTCQGCAPGIEWPEVE